jgi:Xaa-Pro aminopeptidase
MSEFNHLRVDELVKRLRVDGFDALLLFPRPNMAYYTGLNMGLSERLAAALIPMNGNPIFVVNQLEEELRGQTP